MKLFVLKHSLRDSSSPSLILLEDGAPHGVPLVRLGGRILDFDRSSGLLKGCLAWPFWPVCYRCASCARWPFGFCRALRFFGGGLRLYCLGELP